MPPRPAHALHFAVYEEAKELLGGNKVDHSPLLAGAAGTVATVMNDAIMTPVDVIKQRLQVRGRVLGAGMGACAVCVSADV